MQKYMQRALELAAFGIGNVAPNPLVGCVIVHNDKIIGEGWHQKFGGPHAEVNAINSVNNKQLLAESTLYVTLEPCNHHGKTPPCVDLILQYKIPNVVIATLDVNPIVSGKGVARLKENGVEVSFGILAQEAQFQNRRFITFHQKKRPYIILKWAQSADGFIDKKREIGEKGSFQISGKAAQIALHQWRSEEAGILVGKNTALIDNPKLNTRLWEGNNPVRIIIDTNLEVPRTHHIYDNSVRTLIFNRLERGGLYILEDLLCTYLEDELQSGIEKGGWPGMHLNDPNLEIVNRRVDMDVFFQQIIKDLDSSKGEIEFIHFWNQTCVIKKVD